MKNEDGNCKHLTFIPGMGKHCCGISGNACDAPGCPAYEEAVALDIESEAEKEEASKQLRDEHRHPDNK